MSDGPRRSKRIKSQSVAVSYNEDDVEDGRDGIPGSSTSDTYTIGKEKSDIMDASASASSEAPRRIMHRRKKGLLAQLTEFPLDVLLEVCPGPTCLLSGFQVDCWL